MSVRIKVCCIGSVDEAKLAVARGAHALGLVSEMPTPNGVIPDELIRQIAATIPPAVGSFLLTSRTDPTAIVEHQHFTGANTLQLVDRVGPEAIGRLKEELPGISLVSVVHVTSPDAIAEAATCSGVADALLLDSGTPDSQARSLGGTGRTHDWELSRRIVAEASCPVFLAGGLSPDNVGDAIRRVRPFGVDVCSSLRPDGRLDASLLDAFVSEVVLADSQQPA
jgi:phosphoribosylanthranilate isomerase